MDNRFFFITSYDGISGNLIASALNQHADMNCNLSYMDPFLVKLYLAGHKSSTSLIEKFIKHFSQPTKKFNGSIQRFSAFELQHKILVEKTKTPIIKANIVIDPHLRINLILKSWLHVFNNAAIAVEVIEKKIYSLQKEKHNLFELYNFHYYYKHLKNSIKQENISISTPEDKLFIIALAKVLTYDLADLPIGSTAFKFEDLGETENFLKFMVYLTNNKITIDHQDCRKVEAALHSIKNEVAEAQATPYKEWQTKLLNKYLTMRLQTLYYPHIDKPLISYYNELGYQFKNNQPLHFLYTKLISIHLNSNRPAQLINYFDNLEATADHPEDIEVVVNIDDDDTVMESLLVNETNQRKFSLKFIMTPKPASFCDLWQPINKLLDVTDSEAYFLLNISDEMLFATKGWDTLLKKYIGYFPDHIFRLRASRNKFRNYFDRWECSFAQDAIPITTKKWIDIGGDWNPCFGPDSFQQLISFYLAQEGLFSSSNYLRDVPLLDIQFLGDVPSLGMEKEKAWKHNRDHIRAMQICQSYSMQLEARRRAMLLKAHIFAFNNQLANFEIRDYRHKKKICLIDCDTKNIINSIDYKLNAISIYCTNQFRKLRFYHYFGAGKEYKRNFISAFGAYLSATHISFRRLQLQLKYISNLPKKSKLALTFRIPKTTIKYLIKYLLKLFQRLINFINIENKTILPKKYYELEDKYNFVCLENEKLQKLILEQSDKSNPTFEPERSHFQICGEKLKA